MNSRTHASGRLDTERFAVVPLSPEEGRKLAEVLLQDEVLAANVPWLTDKTPDGVLQEACGIELLASAGRIKIWSIVAREFEMPIGAVICRNSLDGIDVEVLVASPFWEHEVVEEVSDPVMDWLEDNSASIRDFHARLH